jgi:hypothetical protein
MYFLTVNKGWVRPFWLRSRLATWILRGLILSQFNVAGANFAPFCSPIAYIKEQSHPNPPTAGEIGPGDPSYERYASSIGEIISKAFVKLALPGNHLSPK